MTDEAVENEVIKDDSDDRPGLRLKKAREAMNLSLEDIAKHLKSSEKIIDALENEDFSNLPQPIYVSGYLKSYANMVSLEAEGILQSYPNLGKTDPVIPKFRASVSGAKFDADSGNKRKKSNYKILVVLLLLIMGAAFSGWVYFKKDGLTEYVSKAFMNKEIVSGTTEIVSNKPEQQLVEKQQVAIQVPVEEVVETVSSRLLLEFTIDSWVEVSDASGKRLVYRLAKAPSRRIVEGEAPFKVFLGNAPGVIVNFNGLPFDLGPHRDGDVAQFTIGKAEDNVKQVN